MGVETLLFHKFTPILTFPLKRGRDFSSKGQFGLNVQANVGFARELEECCSAAVFDVADKIVVGKAEQVNGHLATQFIFHAIVPAA